MRPPLRKRNEKRPRQCLNNDRVRTESFHKNKCTVQALVSQGISIALGSAFTTQPADQHFVSPQSRGSNLRDRPNPCGNLTYRNDVFFLREYCSSGKGWCQEKILKRSRDQQINRRTKAQYQKGIIGKYFMWRRKRIRWYNL